MDLYYYNLNTISVVKWCESKILTVKNFNDLSLECQQIRFSVWEKIKNGGWHMSYFGDCDFIKNKIINFAHQEYNNHIFVNTEFIQNKVSKNEYLYDDKELKQINIDDNPYLPHKYEIYLTNFYN